MAHTEPISFPASDITKEQWSTLRFKREVADRFGVLPNFFCSADAAPGLAEGWDFSDQCYWRGADRTVSVLFLSCSGAACGERVRGKMFRFDYWRHTRLECGRTCCSAGARLRC